ncbi:hypothetical protein EW026_g8371 [Hermanssonia centrifuga]|uniref:Uncharacterized protein n=1 Tax=Hermanssonia centrifuga TaxID=98765 RepID=A0A4S4K4E3_9APHY|nr:hypothetical protein EW026_g8371 [Hermanssonia centrifuga]
MIDTLAERIVSFAGDVHRTRCFDHIDNLIALVILKLFDMTRGQVGATVDEAEKALHALAEGLDLEDEQMLAEWEAEGEDDEYLDGWVGEVQFEGLSHMEKESLQRDIIPVKTVLVKLQKIAFAIIQSSTILLPAWSALLARLKLPVRKMLRDV